MGAVGAALTWAPPRRAKRRRRISSALNSLIATVVCEWDSRKDGRDEECQNLGRESATMGAWGFRRHEGLACEKGDRDHEVSLIVSTLEEII